MALFEFSPIPLVFLLQLIASSVLGQIDPNVTSAPSDPKVNGWTSKQYPDPRIDFAKCGSNSPGFLCDPDRLLTDEERISLKRHIADIESQSKKVFNKSKFCPTGAPDGLQYFIVLMNKIDGSAVGQTETKKFAGEIKAKYDIFKDVNTCDTTVVIVSSRKDGQLYTVAGRDAQLPGGTLENAFSRNVEHFAKGRFAAGLTEMTSELAAAYSLAHSLETTEAPKFGQEANSTTNTNRSTITTTTTTTTTTSSFATSENADQKDNNEITDLTSLSENEANGSLGAAPESKTLINPTPTPTVNLTEVVGTSSLSQNSTRNNASLGVAESSVDVAVDGGQVEDQRKLPTNIENETLPPLLPIVPVSDSSFSTDNSRNVSRIAASPILLGENVTLSPESKALWMNIVQIAAQRCGTQHDSDTFMLNVRAIVSEIRDLSARLNGDEQYQNIQSMVLKLKDDPEGDTKAWNLGGRGFIEPLRIAEAANGNGPQLSKACLNDIFD